MNIETLQALGIHDEVAPPLQRGGEASPVAAPSFGTRVEQALGQINQQLLATQVDLQRLAAGEAANLHEVMVRLEESRIALQLALQIRNRALEAYQDIMRMQV